VRGQRRRPDDTCGGRGAAGVTAVVSNKDVAALLDPAHAVCTTQPSRPATINLAVLALLHSHAFPAERSLPHRLILLCFVGRSSRVSSSNQTLSPLAQTPGRALAGTAGPGEGKQGTLTNHPHRRAPSPILTAPQRAPPPSPPPRPPERAARERTRPESDRIGHGEGAGAPRAT
jgi:hypothetical protein